MEIIKQLRKANNLNQQKLATAVGVARSTIAMWETNGSQPDMTALSKLADYFGVSVDYLLGREKHKEKPAIFSDDELSQLDQNLFNLLVSLTPDEADQTRAYVQGMKDARK